MSFKKLLYPIVLSILGVLSLGGKLVYGQSTNLLIEFRHVIHGRPLVLDSITYKNNLGQLYTVGRLRYYISNIRLIDSMGSERKDKGYYLVDEELSASKIISISTLESGTYTGLEFTLGIDSVHNCSGLQEGELDPIKGMFWAWNTGYIFLKLEGKSPVSPLTGNLIEYHIGGYREPNNAIRNIRLPFPESLTLQSGKITPLKIDVNINEVFSGPININFKELPAVTDFKNAVMMADNYCDMFSIQP